MAAVEEKLSDEQLAELAAMRAAQDGDANEPPEEDGDVTEGTDDDDDDGEEEARAASSAKLIEETYQKIERKVAAYKKGMLALLEATGQPWMESPFDVVPGYLLPFNSEDPEALSIKAAADLYFQAGTKRYKPHPTMVTCPECDGDGRMDNGAREPNTTWALCWACHGSGSRDLTMPAPTPPSRFGQIQPQPPLAAAPAWQPPAPQGPTELLAAPPNWYAQGKPASDQWGRWPGHPRYGIDPDINGGVW